MSRLNPTHTIPATCWGEPGQKQFQEAGCVIAREHATGTHNMQQVDVIRFRQKMSLVV